jgi:hypothetical protein
MYDCDPLIEQDVRKQLVSIMDRYKMDIVTAGRNYNKVMAHIRLLLTRGYHSSYDCLCSVQRPTLCKHC